jgi:hypothetical protein
LLAYRYLQRPLHNARSYWPMQKKDFRPTEYVPLRHVSSSVDRRLVPHGFHARPRRNGRHRTSRLASINIAGRSACHFGVYSAPHANSYGSSIRPAGRGGRRGLLSTEAIVDPVGCNKEFLSSLFAGWDVSTRWELNAFVNAIYQIMPIL